MRYYIGHLLVEGCVRNWLGLSGASGQDKSCLHDKAIANCAAYGSCPYSVNLACILSCMKTEKQSADHASVYGSNHHSRPWKSCHSDLVGELGLMY